MDYEVLVGVGVSALTGSGLLVFILRRIFSYIDDLRATKVDVTEMNRSLDDHSRRLLDLEDVNHAQDKILTEIRYDVIRLQERWKNK